MKKLGISLMLLAMIAYAGMSTTTPVGGEVDLEKSSVEWVGKKVTGKHNGTIKLKEASLKMNEEGMFSGGSFAIDMTTIADLSLAAKAEMQTKLVGHLKSDDFFGVETHPTANLEITKVVHRGTDGSYKVIGDLTIKGITKPIKFNAQFGEEGGMKMVTADLVVDRSEYNVKYGSGSFIENLGDKTIYDEFELKVKLVLK